MDGTDIEDFQNAFLDNILRSEDIYEPSTGTNGHKYGDRLKEALSDGGRNRLIVSMNDLRAHIPEYIDRLMRQPRPYLLSMQDSVREYYKELDPTFEKINRLDNLQVGFEDSLGENACSPRLLFVYVCILSFIQEVVLLVKTTQRYFET